MVRTQIRLTDEQARAIKRIALARRVSVAELIRRAVNGLIKAGVAADPEERRRWAIEIVGKFRSGKRDVSLKHDRYLAQAYGK